MPYVPRGAVEQCRRFALSGDDPISDNVTMRVVHKIVEITTQTAGYHSTSTNGVGGRLLRKKNEIKELKAGFHLVPTKTCQTKRKKSPC
jgi:hypothetical protein